MSKTKHASHQSTGLPSVITPMPVVWSVTPSGVVWWNVEGDKWILKSDLEMELYELWIGTLCDTHGFEGTFVTVEESWDAAVFWLCDVPHVVQPEKMN